MGSFHGVLASGSLIHVAADRMPDLLRRIGGVLLPEGILAAIVRDGDESVVSRTSVAGVELERTIYRYTLNAFTNWCAFAGLQFQREELDEALHRDGWRCHYFRKP